MRTAFRMTTSVDNTRENEESVVASDDHAADQDSRPAGESATWTVPPTFFA